MSPPSQAELADCIVELLYPNSANRLPEICARLGLAPGDRDEAMNSKRAYVRKRIAGFDGAKLRELGREIDRGQPDLRLSEMVAKLDEASEPELGLIARRRIVGLFDMEGYSLSGDLRLSEFLEPIWPVSKMRGPADFPGTEVSLKGRIERHAEINADWSHADVLKQVGAIEGSRLRFCRMLEAAVHPLTRDDDEDRARLVFDINEHLELDGWSLQVVGRTSGLPVYAVRRIALGDPHAADVAISEGLAAFDEESVHAEWQRALGRRASDPRGAITAARTLLETVCKHVLDDAGVAYREKDDLPQLYKATAKVLRLAPSQHTEEVFRQILGGCTAVVEGLGSLRNRLSDAHGQGRKPTRPSARHAQLAVNLAGAMAIYLVSTWTEKAKGVP